MKILLTILLLTLILAALNRMSIPAESEANRTASRIWGDAVALLLCGVIFPALILITGRYVTSIGIGLGLILALWAGNGLKVRILGESLVFSDIFLAGHALRWPRLYFGYAPKWVWPVVALLVLLIGFAGAEEPVAAAADYTAAAWLCGGFAVLALVCATGLRRSGTEILKMFPVSFDSRTDMENYTPLGAAVLHTLHHLRNREVIKAQFSLPEDEEKRAEAETAAPLEERHPAHFILIQAESWCPVAELTGRVSVTPTLDQLREKSLHGKLLLDWRGAYTMRTEFSVLTGLAVRALETFGFDPYRLAARISMASLARDFRASGWKAVAWHPNDGRFFDRTEVMPNLGFEHFADSSELGNLPLNGRYASDEALLAAAAEYLEKSESPTFLFIVTMEGHGPWTGEAGRTETEAYEKRLASLDRGIAKLVTAIREKLPGTRLAIYGDHLPGIRDLAHVKSGDTAWMLWPGRNEERDLRPEEMRPLIREEVLA
ncbi:LTA synthase family protein [Sutterella sp.]|uniref:LTA synthase family protein n=1 Tax=Sutterella sp. TaxID=1981025 RepID=UPI0026DED4F3|nr:sulfatase-like hydrolase/transferase [Sutterella sp.]MDO5531767.1 sulfatase-like hydrolase/transferase [Sutterella sp.]